MKHSILSPSAAHRWIMCPPSARLEAKIPEETSPFAEEGTQAHAGCEAFLKNGFDNFAFTRQLLEDNGYTEEMIDYCEAYAQYVKSKKEDLGAMATYLVEERVQTAPTLDAGQFGTCDCIILGAERQRLYIVDFKYGMGVPVSATDNPQLKLYALGAYLRYQFHANISRIVLCIYQPRIHNVSEWETTPEELLKWYQNTVEPQGRLALDGEGSFASGSWCKFCKCRGVCRQLMQDSAKSVFGITSVEEPLLNNEDISQVLQNAPKIRLFLDAVEKEALKRMLDGSKVTGFKLVAGRSNRKIVDEVGLFERLKAAGFWHEDVTVRKLRTITELERMVGKDKLKEIAGETIQKAAFKPVIATEDDKREAYNHKENILTAFNL